MEKKEIITGRNPVFEYLKSEQGNIRGDLHVSSSAHGKIINDIINLAKNRNIRVLQENKDFFKKFSSSSSHQGVALSVSIKSGKKDPALILKDIRDKKGVILLLDQITDPHNLGSIIRSAEALGCGAVALPKNNSAEITETVIKASAGATAYMETITITNAAQFLEDIKKDGFWIVGTSDHGTVKIGELSDIRPACLIIGSEGKGMRRLTEEKCDYIVSIPLKGKVSSLNASVAAGIALYEILKD
jgi:23S rRNA (guanosine2251-2'-O)-methyltransferase